MWTPDEEFWLTKMRNEGIGFKQISEELGRPWQSVAVKAKRLGITKLNPRSK